MSSSNYYDVTTWPVGNPAEDVGEVINSIIADIKAPAEPSPMRLTAESRVRSSTFPPGTTASARRW